MSIDGAGAIKLVFMAIVGLLCIDIALTGLLGSVIAAFIDPSALTDTTPGGGLPPPTIPSAPLQTGQGYKPPPKGKPLTVPVDANGKCPSDPNDTQGGYINVGNACVYVYYQA